MKRLMRRNIVPIIIVLLLAVWGAAVSIPNTFSSGDVVSSGLINDNFTTLATAVTGVETFTGNLAGAPCTAGQAIAAVGSTGLPSCVAVSGGAGLTSVTHDGSLVGAGTAGSPLKVAVPLNLTTFSSKALELNGSGTGVGNATLRSINNGTGIAAWLQTDSTGSTDTTLGISQRGNGPIIKAFGNHGNGNEEFRIDTDGTFLLFKPDATTTADFNIKLDNGNGHVVAVAFDTLSDVHAKDSFAPVDPAAVLAALDAMPIRSWSFKDDTGAARHVGPTAQDFHAAFGFGDSPTRIATVDADGVAFAAIQALSRENRALRQDLANLSERLAALETALAGRSE